MLLINGRIIKKAGSDFDGVVLGLVLSREWAHHFFSGKDSRTNKGTNHKILQLASTLTELLRNPRLGVKHGLNTLKPFLEQFYLVSARNEVLKEQSLKWLKKNNLDVFDNHFFNAQGKTPTDFKCEVIRHQELDLFIDDNPRTCIEIAKEFPNVIVFNLQNKNDRFKKYEADNLFIFKEWSDIEKFINQASS